jgi:hypothetical protein
VSRPATFFTREAHRILHDAPAAFLSLLHALDTMDEEGRRALAPVVTDLLVAHDRDAHIASLMRGDTPEDSIRRALWAMHNDA